LNLHTQLREQGQNFTCIIFSETHWWLDPENISVQSSFPNKNTEFFKPYASKWLDYLFETYIEK
jgi:hypothetical protein